MSESKIESTPNFQGCKRLFLLTQAILAAGRDSDIGQIIGLHNSETSNWKHGKRLITNLKQYIELANATGTSALNLYLVAIGHHSTLKQERTPMLLTVPEVTVVGSVLLYFHVKYRLSAQKQEVKVTGTEIGKHLGFSPNEMTRWKRGNRLITKASDFFNISRITGDTVEELYAIASSWEVPIHLSKYLDRANRYDKAQRKSKKLHKK